VALTHAEDCIKKRQETGKTNEPVGRQEERNDGMQSWTGSSRAKTGRGDK
jgi:hypothetical protein